jgi:hypothetical protein
VLLRWTENDKNFERAISKYYSSRNAREAEPHQVDGAKLCRKRVFLLDVVSPASLGRWRERVGTTALPQLKKV